MQIKAVEFSRIIAKDVDMVELEMEEGSTNKLSVLKGVKSGKTYYQAVSDLCSGGFINSNIDTDLGNRSTHGKLDRVFGGDEKYMIMSDRDQYRTFVALEDIGNESKGLSAFLNEPEPLIRELLDNTDKHYNVFSIPKKDGRKRWIEAPDADLKRVQRTILHKVIYRAGASPHAHGFIHGRSIVTNAKVHSDKYGSENKTVLKIDLYNFFPSIGEEMAGAALMQMANAEHGRLIPSLVRLCTYRKRLPQGAPTSPALSNIAVSGMDVIFAKMASRMDATYSRYADDLAFVSRNRTIWKLIPVVKDVVSKFGLSVNGKKVNVLGCGRRQKVTGVVINQKISIDRDRRMRMRACLHNILTGKMTADDTMMRKISGTMSFFNMVNKEQTSRFTEDFNKVKEMMNASRQAAPVEVREDIQEGPAAVPEVRARRRRAKAV
jgi:retron-type reverse transcriptase